MEEQGKRKTEHRALGVGHWGLDSSSQNCTFNSIAASNLLAVNSRVESWAIGDCRIEGKFGYTVSYT